VRVGQACRAWPRRRDVQQRVHELRAAGRVLRARSCTSGCVCCRFGSAGRSDLPRVGWGATFRPSSLPALKSEAPSRVRGCVERRRGSRVLRERV
jgi:hypothetical protein